MLDILAGPQSSVPTKITDVNGIAVFSANNGTLGTEPWQSDGSTAGTSVLRDIRPGLGSSFPLDFTVVNGKLFFAATDPVVGRELWTSDGTTAGTQVVKDVQPGPGSSMFRILGPLGVGPSIAFAANDGPTGYELWVSDGTAAGTTLLTDLAPGPYGSFPGGYSQGFLNAGTTVFFTADDGSTGGELFGASLPLLGAAYWEHYARGCAGSAGLIPLLDWQGLPTIGSSCTLGLSVARASSAAAFLLGGASGNQPLGGGCAWLLSGPVIALPTTTDSSGAASLAVAIPAITTLVGATVSAQAAVVDPQGSLGGVASVTGGLRIVVGR